MNKDTKIVILHHHLKRGGVTRIISSQIKSLNDAGFKNITVLTGEKPVDEKEFPAEIKVFEPLNYLLNKHMSHQETLGKYAEIYRFIKTEIDQATIIHVHNLNLGKNPLVTLAVSKLAGEGHKVFNHSHDFAEDRKENYQFLKNTIEHSFNESLFKTLYPALDNYRFGVLNRADLDRLLCMDVDGSRIEFLPNPVSVPDYDIDNDSRNKLCEELNIDPERQIFVYPVRVIRRKNIGELVLLAYLLKDKGEFLVTQPPQNPIEIEAYEDWLEYCDSKHFTNIKIEVGTKIDFETIMTGADKCITTSIQEGFGMMYLEPWMFGKAVVGRNIYYVTQDFIDSGIQFPFLYDAIDISFLENNEAYESNDFGLLAKKDQMEIITLIMNNDNIKKEMYSLNPQLERITDDVSGEIIDHNRALIKEDYSLEKYGERLNEIYSKFSKKS